MGGGAGRGGFGGRGGRGDFGGPRGRGGRGAGRGRFGGNLSTVSTCAVHFIEVKLGYLPHVGPWSCRLGPVHLLGGWCKRQLDQGSVSLC